jgi:hypothetical protein
MLRIILCGGNMSFARLTPTLAFVFLAIPAHAQVDTNCSWFGSEWRCQSRDPNANANALGALLGSIAREKREKKERQAAIEAENARLAQQRAYAEQQAYAVKQEQTFMAIVSQAVQAGECEDAKAIALSANRLDIAEQAARICTPKRKPSAQ